MFVGIETRNGTRQAALNTRALEIAAYQELMSNIDEINALSLQSESTAAVMSRIWPDESQDPDVFRANRALYILFRHGDLAFFMYERGAIDESRLLSALAILPIQTQVGRDFWAARNGSFTESYKEYVDRMIAELEERGDPN